MAMLSPRWPGRWWQAEDDGDLDLAGQHVGEDDALVGDQRVQRVRDGVAHDDRAFARPLARAVSMYWAFSVSRRFARMTRML